MLKSRYCNMTSTPGQYNKIASVRSRILEKNASQVRCVVCTEITRFIILASRIVFASATGRFCDPERYERRVDQAVMSVRTETGMKKYFSPPFYYFSNDADSEFFVNGFFIMHTHISIIIYIFDERSGMFNVSLIDTIKNVWSFFSRELDPGHAYILYTYLHSLAHIPAV